MNPDQPNPKQLNMWLYCLPYRPQKMNIKKRADEARKDLNHFIFATLGPIGWLDSIRLRRNVWLLQNTGEKYDNSEVYMYATCPILGSCQSLA